MNAYEVQLAPAAVRSYKKLPSETRNRIRKALAELGEGAAEPGILRGKRVRTIRGVADTFHRLRVGDYRVMYDVLEKKRVILVLGIVHRRDLERWLRSR